MPSYINQSIDKTFIKPFDTSQVNQLTGFYMRAALAFNALTKTEYNILMMHLFLCFIKPYAPRFGTFSYYISSEIRDFDYLVNFLLPGHEQQY